MVQYIETFSNEIIQNENYDVSQDGILEREESYNNMPSLEYDYYYPTNLGYYYSSEFQNEEQYEQQNEEQYEQQNEEVYQPLIYSNNFSENYPYEFNIRLELPSFLTNYSSQINSQ